MSGVLVIICRADVEQGRTKKKRTRKRRVHSDEGSTRLRSSFLVLYQKKATIENRNLQSLNGYAVNLDRAEISIRYLFCVKRVMYIIAKFTRCWHLI